MKKKVEFLIAGIFAICIGAIAFLLFLVASKNRALPLCGSFLFIAAGVILILIYKRKPEVKPPQPITPTSTNSYPVMPKYNINIPEMINGQPLKYRYKDVKICVTAESSPNYESIHARMSSGTPVYLSLVQEPENPNDNKAVAVMDGENKIGYLYKGKIQDIANDYIKAERPIFSVISGLSDSNEITAFIGFYYLKPYSKSTVIELSNALGKDIQEEITCCSVGDILTISFDEGKEKYAFIRASEVGYAPKKYNDLLDSVHNDCFATINSIDYLDEKDKYAISVKILHN